MAAQSQFDSPKSSLEPSNSKYQSFRDIHLDSCASLPSKKGFFSGFGEQIGPQCFSCNTPWTEKTGFIHGRHSRNCTECGVR